MGEDDFATDVRVRTIEDFLAASSAGASSLAVYDERLYRVEKWLGEMHGVPSVALLDASKRDLEALKKKLRSMASGPHIAVILRMFYKSAGRRDIAEFLRIKQRQKRLSPDDILEPEHVNQLIAHSLSVRDRALHVTLWNCGERISATLNVNLGDVKAIPSPENGGRRFYRVHFRRTKRDEPHDGYITEGVDHFESWLRVRTKMRDAGPDAPLFVSFEGRRLSKEAAEKMVRETAIRAGLMKREVLVDLKTGRRTVRISGQRVHPHVYRHSRCTHFLRLGLSESTIKRLLGWAPASTMINRYAHLSMGDAYASLLKSQGYKVPETTEYSKILGAEAGLEDVVPMVPPPGARPAESGTPNTEPWPSLVGVDADTFERFAKTVAKYQVELLKSQPAPAWSPDVRRMQDLEAKIHELEARVERKGAAP